MGFIFGVVLPPASWLSSCTKMEREGDILQMVTMNHA